MGPQKNIDDIGRKFPGKEGAVAGTLDLGGAPEQAVSDGKGTIYVNISDKANIAVVDAKSMTVKAHYDVSSKRRGGSGLAFDAGNHILFAYYRQPPKQSVIGRKVSVIESPSDYYQGDVTGRNLINCSSNG